MRLFRAALWSEFLKARRSLVPWLAALGFCITPLVGGLFMLILKDPERAKSMGLISAKAQLTVGVADWTALLGILSAATAVGGALLFAFMTAWIFGREFSDHTAKELLAVSTRREMIVGAKFVVIGVWAAALMVVVFVLGILVGAAVGLPGWSSTLMWRSASDLAVTAILTVALMTPVALFASIGHGYLPPLGWAVLTVALAQIAAAMGWGDWFPWSVPALFSEMAGPRAAQVGPHSYVVVAFAFAVGLMGTFAWWRSADQTR
jgi:ABC-2 type transport system permease protein